MCFTSFFLNLSERNNDMELNFNREIYDKKYFRVLESNTFMEEKEYTKVRSFSTMAIPVIQLDLEMGEKLSFKLLKC